MKIINLTKLDSTTLELPTKSIVTLQELDSGVRVNFVNNFGYIDSIIVSDTISSILAASDTIFEYDTDKYATALRVKYIKSVTGGTEIGYDPHNITSTLSLSTIRDRINESTVDTEDVEFLQAQIDSITSGSINVDTYGAVGDGVTDDTQAIKNAIAASGNNGLLQFTANKTYLISSGLSIAGGLYGQTWIGYGATIKRADEVVSTTTAIVADGATSIPVADGTLFSIGDNIILSDVTSPNGGVGFDEVSDNSPTITNIVGNTLTIDEAITLPVNGNLVGSYPSSTKVIRVFNMITGAVGGIGQETPFFLIGIKFDGNRSNNTSYQGWIFNSTFRNIPFDSVVSDCQFVDIPNENLFPSKGCRVVQCVGNNLNGSFTHTSIASSTGGMNIFALNRISNASLTSIDIAGHNESVFTYSANAKKTIIQGNQISDCSGQVFGAISAVTNNIDDHTILADNLIINVNGVCVGNSSVIGGRLSIVNNQIYNADWMILDKTSTGSDNIAQGSGFDLIEVCGNIIENCKFYFSECSNITISNNQIRTTDDYTYSTTVVDNASLTFKRCANVIITNNTLENLKETEDTELVYGIVCDTESGGTTLFIKSDISTSTDFRYSGRNFNVSNNVISGYGVGIHSNPNLGSNSIGTSYLGMVFSANTIMARETSSVSIKGIHACPGVIVQNNTIYGPAAGAQGIYLQCVLASKSALLNGPIVKGNTILGFNESIQVASTSDTASDGYNAFVIDNLYDGTIDDRSAGRSTLSGNTAIINGAIPIFNVRQNTGFY